MAGTAKKSPPELKIIAGELGEGNSDSGEGITLGKAFMLSAKYWSGVLGVGILLFAGAIVVKQLGDKKQMAKFSMMMNLEEIVEGGGNNSGITDLAMQNLEGMKEVGGEELLLLRRAIEKVEAKCRGECEPLIRRMKVLQKKWEKQMDSKRPVSDLKWKRPGLKKALPVFKGVPEKVARSRC